MTDVLKVDLSLDLDQDLAALVDGHVDRIVRHGDAGQHGIAVVGDDLAVGVELEGAVAGIGGLAVGSYDIYLTDLAREVILAGPIRIDVEFGDVLGGMIFDTNDPNVLELEFLPNNP